jgi:hypothetical protein
MENHHDRQIQQRRTVMDANTAWNIHGRFFDGFYKSLMSSHFDFESPAHLLGTSNLKYSTMYDVLCSSIREASILLFCHIWMIYPLPEFIAFSNLARTPLTGTSPEKILQIRIQRVELHQPRLFVSRAGQFHFFDMSTLGSFADEQAKRGKSYLVPSPL